jgi:hypothetical protein
MSAGSGAGTEGAGVEEHPEDTKDSPAGAGSESDPHEAGDHGPDADTPQAEAPAAAAEGPEPDPEPVAATAEEPEPDDPESSSAPERGEPEPGTGTREYEPEDVAADRVEGDPPAATTVAEPEGVAEPAVTSAIEADPPASTPGPRFVPPRYDPSSLPPAESVHPVGPVDVTPEPAVRPQVPRQYATGGVPIVEIEGGWDAVYRRRRRQTLTFVAGFLVVLVLGCVAWLTYAGVVPWPFGGAVSVAQNVCTHSKPLTPKKISVRVFNGSGRDGLARQVAAQLKTLGFAVKTTGNDPLESKIKTQVEVRHGESGDVAAATMSAYVVGKTKDVQDDRQDSSIDLVLGPSFSRLHSKTELKKSLAAVTATLPMTCPAGVTPPSSATPTPSATPKARVTPRPTATRKP